MLSDYNCVPNKWLDQYPADPLDCIPYIRADSSCVGSYYLHAGGGDNHCACLTSDVDCSSASSSAVSPDSTWGINIHLLFPEPPPPSPPPTSPPLPPPTALPSEPPPPAPPCECMTTCPALLSGAISAAPSAGGFVAGNLVALLAVFVCSRLKPGNRKRGAAERPHLAHAASDDPTWLTPRGDRELGTKQHPVI